jgi:hypothetical protein
VSGKEASFDRGQPLAHKVGILLIENLFTNNNLDNIFEDW